MTLYEIVRMNKWVGCLGVCCCTKGACDAAWGVLVSYMYKMRMKNVRIADEAGRSSWWGGHPEAASYLDARMIDVVA